ncbi:MAG: SDR family oxidoreductase [Thermomicrobiales bacterium]
MDMGLKDKVAVVCAASKGLGKSSAALLAEEGTNLVICARGEEVLQQTAAEIRQKTGVTVVTVAADLSKEADCTRVIETAQREFGGLDILVNNAGGPPPGFFMDFTDAQWEAGFETNFMSAVRLIRLAIPIMQARGGGRVINIVSYSVKQPIENLIISNSIRAAVIGLTKTLSQQFGKDGITFNNVLPGTILTDRVRQTSRTQAEREGISVDEVIERGGKSVPMGRIGQPDDLGSLVVYLASARAEWLTGTSTQIDGGAYKGLM